MKSNKQPLVSIGLITYNRSRSIKNALSSLLSQSYKNFEIIISDDASIDDTAIVCKRFVQRDKRIRFFKQNKNLGLPHNSNFVLTKANGKYFMWASDDDTWHKDFVKDLVEMLEGNPSAGLAASDYRLYKKGIAKTSGIVYPKRNSGLSLIKNYLTKTPLLVWGIFRKHTLLDCGGFHTDSRPFLFRGSDNITVFRVLLRSDLMFSQKILWFKKDSGYALNPDINLKRMLTSPVLRDKIKRYLLYPIMFCYDFYYLVFYSIKSDYKGFQKFVMVFHCGYWFINTLIDYLKTLLRSAWRSVFLSLSSERP